MITVKNLTKYYGNKLGVEGVSFHIEKGEIVGLLGPNGAGKSTIMRMLAGYMPPSGGEITVGGADIVADPSQASRYIGYLPELPPLYMEMSVERYLTFLAEIRRIPSGNRESHVTEAMKLANIADVRKRLIRNLSKGYRQRVGIAQALIGRPEVLIFDEPTVGLDPKQITEVRSLIAMLSQDHTIFLSSHILSEIRMTCERVLIINRGHLLVDDTFAKLSGGGNVRYIVTTKGDFEQAQNALVSIAGVLGAEPEEKGTSDGFARFFLMIDPKAGALDRLSIEMSSKGFPLFELKEAEKTLEEVFLSVISQPEPVQPEKEEA